MQPVIIQTPRFTLRPYRKRDLPSIAKHINDRQIIRDMMLTIPYPYTIRDAEEEYRKFRNIMRRKNPDRKAIAIEIDGETAGIVGISIKGHQAEIGYWLGRAYWGKGNMTEAVKEITKYCFKHFGLRRIYAHTFPHNKASIRVLKKAGYEFEGILRKNVKTGNRYFDQYLFARVR